MSTLYDYRTGENLGPPTDEQDGEPEGHPFWILWQPRSALHARVLEYGAPVPVAFGDVREVVVFERDAYLERFNGRPVWHTVSL